jgi:hypothetical protein
MYFGLQEVLGGQVLLKKGWDLNNFHEKSMRTTLWLAINWTGRQ